MTERDFVAAVVELYTRLPNTPERPRAPDRRLARQWFRQGIPLPKLQAALWLGSARRVNRPPGAGPLQPIRSLYYFVSVLAEILDDTLDPDYLRHLENVAPAGRQNRTETFAAQQRRRTR